VDEFHVHLEYMHNGITFWCHPNFKSIVWLSYGSIQHWFSQIILWKETNWNVVRPLFFKQNYVFVLPDDDMTYAIIHSMFANNNDNDSILYERWELDIHQVYNKMEKMLLLKFMWLMFILLVIQFFSLRTTEQNILKNTESAMTTVVLPSAKIWPNKFMSLYCQ